MAHPINICGLVNSHQPESASRENHSPQNPLPKISPLTGTSFNISSTTHTHTPKKQGKNTPNHYTTHKSSQPSKRSCSDVSLPLLNKPSDPANSPTSPAFVTLSTDPTHIILPETIGTLEITVRVHGIISGLLSCSLSENHTITLMQTKLNQLSLH